MKRLFRIIIFLAIGVLLSALIGKLKFVGLPQWAELPLLYLIFLSIYQILLLIKTSKPLVFSPTLPESFLGLKLDLLENYTNQLTSLGFTNFSDCRTVNFTPPIFFRIFFNAEQQCLAAVLQTSSGLMKCTILSLLTEGWSLANLNYRTDNFNFCFSQILSGNQRALWLGQSDIKLKQVLATHIERRQQLIRDIDIKIIENLSVDSFCNYETILMKKYHQNLKQKWLVIAMIEALWLFLHPKTEWMGEYQARLDILKNSAF